MSKPNSKVFIELLDRLQEAEADVLDWFDRNIKTRLDSCENVDEINDIMRELHCLRKSNKDQLRKLPDPIRVYFYKRMADLVILKDDLNSTDKT